MADRTGKCVNFGLCGKADSREIIPVAGGGDFSCPECGKPLTEVSAGGATGGAKAASGKKAIAIGALGLALIAGTAYKFLSAPPESTDKTDKGSNLAVINPPNPGIPQNPQDPNAPVLPPVQNGPETPNQKAPGISPNENVPMRQTPPPVRRPPQTPPDVEPPERAPAAEKPVRSAPGTMVARLLNPISTKTSSEGDQFQAKVENGPYRGQILTGTIKKLSKGKKNTELELDFTKLNGNPIPVKLDLTSISNSQGVKGVDDENNRIEGQSSKKKIAIITAIGAGVGAGFGKLIGKSGKATAIGAVGGGGVAYLLSVKVISHAKDIELNPGSQLTLRESAR
jgi:hypothetical protein